MTMNVALGMAVFLSGLVMGWLISLLLSRWRHSDAISRLRDETSKEIVAAKQELASSRAGSGEQLLALRRDIDRIQGERLAIGRELVEKVEQVGELQRSLATATADVRSGNEVLKNKLEELTTVNGDLSQLGQQFIKSEQSLALAQAENRTLESRLKTQVEEIEALRQRFTMEFENMATRILESNSQKFTDLNKTNMAEVLGPLGKQITEFKDQVTKVYQDESKERFSLGENVKALAELNTRLAQEANNLSTALRNESKTQGRWGEVILETILERSGLRKGETYFMEYQLFGPDGQPLRSEARGTKMRPDAVVKYPDNRHVIIDSKVSLNAFVRSTEVEDPGQRSAELGLHLHSIRGHIVDLQSKAYDDYDKTLDFVMMFVPMEAAYIAAVEYDPEIWQFAYERRVLLINPTNLIVCLKLIVDLWKREYQNQNAQAIAERGGKLYDKFVGFVNKLQAVGGALDSARSSYDEAYKQLSTGRDNLVVQATKLKALGVKTKYDLPESLVMEAYRDSDLPIEGEE